MATSTPDGGAGLKEPHRFRYRFYRGEEGRLLCTSFSNLINFIGYGIITEERLKDALFCFNSLRSHVFEPWKGIKYPYHLLRADSRIRSYNGQNPLVKHGWSLGLTRGQMDEIHQKITSAYEAAEEEGRAVCRDPKRGISVKAFCGLLTQNGYPQIEEQAFLHGGKGRWNSIPSVLIAQTLWQRKTDLVVVDQSVAGMLTHERRQQH